MGRSATIVIGAILAVGAGGYGVGYLLNSGWSAKEPSSPVSSGFVGFDPAETDLGSHLWGSVIPFQLSFVNGGKPITIQSVAASCDCVVLDRDELAGRVIEAGESLSIAATVSVGKQPGGVIRQITLEAETGEKWTAVLALDVVGTWNVSADRVDFGEYQLGTSRTEFLERSFTFTSDSDTLLGQPESEAPWIMCFVAPRDSTTCEVLLRISVDRLLPGIHTTQVVFRTTSDVRPDFVILARVSAIPALIVKPPNVFLVGNEMRRVSVFDPNGDAVNLVEAAPSDDRLTIRLVRSNSIEISNPSGRLLARIVTVRVKDSNERSVEIRVSAF